MAADWLQVLAQGMWERCRRYSNRKPFCRGTLLFALGAVAACTTGYGPKGFSGGYSDVQVDANHFIVAFDGNNSSGSDRVWNFWIYRCAELTKEKGFTYFGMSAAAPAAPAALAAPPMPATNPAPPTLGPPGVPVTPGTAVGATPHASDFAPSSPQVRLSDGVYRPTDAARPIAVAHGGGGGGVIFVPGGTYTSFHSRALVAMYPDPLPAEAGVVLRAQEVLDLLGPFVKSDGKNVAPIRAAVLRGAETKSALIVSYDKFLQHVAVVNAGKHMFDLKFSAQDVVAETLRLFPNGVWSSIGRANAYLNETSVEGGPSSEIYAVVGAPALLPSGVAGYRFDRYRIECSTHAMTQVAGGMESGFDYRIDTTPMPGDASMPASTSKPLIADAACNQFGPVATDQRKVVPAAQ